VSGVKVAGDPHQLAYGVGRGFRRKLLHGLAAVVEYPAATEHEKANAQAAKARLQHRLTEAGSPARDWTGNVFRLGRWAEEMRKSTSSASPKGDWTDNASGSAGLCAAAIRAGYRISGLRARSALLTHRRARAADRFG
jgi:hypothetical protein